MDLANSADGVSLVNYVVKQLDEHSIEVEVAKSQGLNDVFTQLSAQGHQVLSMRNKANRLEELFVGLLAQTAGEKNHA